MDWKIIVISGGQTGADRAALDVALFHNLTHGGWCPKGRRAEDGPIPGIYLLKETPSANYLQRTEWNVRDTDGTLVFTLSDKPTGGSLKTVAFAKKHGKPCLHIGRVARSQDPALLVRQFITEHDIRRLNVAGSRESKEPGIAQWVKETLSRALLPSGEPILGQRGEC